MTIQGSVIHTSTIGTGPCPHLVRHRDPLLDDEDVRNALFVGFDELYFSSEGFSTPKPAQLVLAFRIIENIGLGPDSVRWIEENECLLELGDGCVLNVLIGYRTTSRVQPAVHLPVFGTFVSLA